ncbi:MAG: haloacid dehalogenase type II [Gammaproteobacteria bacterium]
MADMKLSDFNLLSFDCYGTLIDWDTGIRTALQNWYQREGVTESWHEILTLHGRLEAEQEAATPSMRYRDVLGEVLKKIGRELNVRITEDDAQAYGKSIGDWPAFPDSLVALQYLKQHFTLVILSNVDRASFVCTNARLGVEFDYIFTAEEIGSYKPNEKNFLYMRSKLDNAGFTQDQHLHVAESLYHDHAPAQKLGYKTCWINRRHETQGSGATLQPGSEPQYNYHFTSLAQLAGVHQRERER